MHEFGIMQSVLEIVADACRSAGLTDVTLVEMEVGELTAALPDALYLAWEALATDEPFAPGAQLLIEERPSLGECRACGQRFHPEDGFRLVCPHCGALGARLIQGDELRVVAVEAAETRETAAMADTADVAHTAGRVANQAAFIEATRETDAAQTSSQLKMVGEGDVA